VNKIGLQCASADTLPFLHQGEQSEVLSCF
jgi:hypothetical protein